MGGPMDMQYREARASDAESIALLHAESWQFTYRGIMRDEFLKNNAVQNRCVHWKYRLTSTDLNQFVLLAEEGEFTQGFVCVIAKADAQWGALLDNLHVRPDMKGHGIGTALIYKAGKWVQANFPQSGLHLWVFEANHPARRFYERLGATNQQREIGEVTGGGTAPVLHYVWTSVEQLVELKKDLQKHKSVMQNIH